MKKEIGCHPPVPGANTVASGCMILLFVLLLMVPGPVHSLELTSVTHLYDIRHEFSHPSDIAVAADGSTYVVDGVNQCIKVFDENGRFLFLFGEAGDKTGQFNFPLGIDVDNSGNIYVADSGNHRIQIFTARGKYLTEIKLTTKNSEISDPTDVAVLGDGKTAFIVDNRNHCVLKYDLKSGKQTAVFGKPGTEKLEFRYPFLASAYKNKYLFIVDVINTRVQEITRDGKFVRFIGDWGVEKGQFFRPKGIAVDSRGKVYVSDSYMGVIQVFDEGVFHSVVGDSTKGELWRYNTPVGIVIDAKDRLYVVEMLAGRVSVFAINQ